MTESKNTNFRELPVIPLRGISVFPNNLIPFDVGRDKSIKALEEGMMTGQMIFLTAQKDAEVDLPTSDDYYHIGTVAEIKQMLKMPGNIVRVLVEGVCRAEIKEIMQETPFIKCKVEERPDVPDETGETNPEALARTLLEAFDEYMAIDSGIPGQLLASVDSLGDPAVMADAIVSHLNVKIEDKQSVLESFDVRERVEKAIKLLNNEIEISKLENDINRKVRGRINRNQRDYFLREQLKTIQEELGQDENVDAIVEEYTEQLAALKLPKKIHEKLEKEIKRLYIVQAVSSEGAVIRTYLDWIMSLPWNKSTKDSLDLNKAETILNEDHYGLEKVKERILEYLAVRHLSKDVKGSVICLVGPPGVGKTSIAKSLARAMNRKFVRMSLGGVRDEAEIRGHRRTYIGSMPGRVISLIRDAESSNPVFLFDEIDKVGADYKGDPSSALLEVLDPEQNKAFSDNFLEVPFDLSKVMFITTANTTDTIPAPLLDRMEVIEISGYTEEEKLNIARKYLVPKKIKENGLKDKQISFSEDAIRDIINYYTRESGVRNLEREISNICRKSAKKIVQKTCKSTEITAENLTDYLGRHKFLYDKIEDKPEIGMVTGLAWTVVGGETLSIETTVMDGTGKLVLTGKLGDVMQESAKAGISYIRSIADSLNIDKTFYKDKDIHIHIPEGAIPKDGPSAGITMCTSVISALTQTPVRNDLAMTGEITLRGKVLPVGGIKEKVLAAHRAGIKKILLPMENKRDIEDIPENVRTQLEFEFVENVAQVLENALVKE